MRGSTNHAAALLLAGLASLVDLGRYPSIRVNEAWIATSGCESRFSGRLGDPPFDEFHGMERRDYDFPSLLPLLQGSVLHLNRGRRPDLATPLSRRVRCPFAEAIRTIHPDVLLLDDLLGDNPVSSP